MSTLTRALLAGTAVLAVAAGSAATGAALRPVYAQPAKSAPAPTPTGLRACATEDDHGPCYWDAAHRGNHKGRSFVVLGGQVLYLEPVPQRMALKPWRDNLRSIGATRLPADAIPGHGECWAVIPDGDTAVAVCRDGWVEVS